MPTDALPNDLDALRALVSQLTSERDAAIAESRRLTEQNDQLRHLLKQLQRAQFGQRSERLDRDQMQLALEDIETSLADRNAEEQEPQNGVANKPADQREKRRINRKRFNNHTRRPDGFATRRNQAARRTRFCSAQAQGSSSSSFFAGQPLTSLARMSARYACGSTP
jgi:hypothetical protein